MQFYQVMKKGLFYLVCLFVTCVGRHKVGAQEVYLRSYSTSEGLPSPTVYDIVSDKRGYIWLVTEAGPVRFDGENFLTPVQQHTQSKPGSLLVEDHMGRIWYESFDGYLLFIQNDTVRSLSQSFPLGYISFVVNRQHIVYVTPQGLEYIPLNRLNRRFRVPIADFEPDHLFQSSDTTIAIQGGNWIHTLSHGQQFRRRLDEPLYHLAPIFTPGEKGLVYVTSKFDRADRSIYAFSSQTSFKICKLPFQQAIQSFKYYQGAFWIGTAQGIYVVDTSGKIRWDIPGLNVTAIYHHPNGGVWIGTRNQGIFRLDDLNMRLQTLPASEFPLVLSSHENKLLIGTEQGRLWEVSPEFNRKPIQVFQTQHEIAWIKSIGKNQLALGSDQLYLLDTKYQERMSVSMAAKDVVNLGNGNVGVAATGFFGYFNFWKSRNERKKLQQSDFDGKWLSQVRGKWLVQDPATGDLYFAGNMGLFGLRKNQLREIRWDSRKKIFVQYLFWYQDKVWVITTDHQMWCREVQGWRKQAELPAPFYRVKVMEGRLFASSDQQIYEWIQGSWQVVRSIAVHDRLIDFVLLQSDMYCLVKNQIIRFPMQWHSQNRQSTLLVHPPKQTPLLDGELVEIPYSLIDFQRQRGKVAFQVNQAPWVDLDPKANQVRLSALAPGNYQVRFKVDDDIREIRTFHVPLPWFKHPITWLTCLILLFLGYYLFHRIRLRRLAEANQLIVDKLHLENRLKESRIQLIKAQMNPHFFFNALNTIQSFIATHENKLAENYLQQFSQLTRMILDMTDKSVISLSEELAMQRTYLDLQRVRLKDFTYAIEVEQSLIPEETFLPTMLLQPYVENALLHGLGHSLKEKRLFLRFTRHENLLKIEIEDNGIGRQKAAQIQLSSRRKHKSFATQASLERIALSHQDHLQIHIEDLPQPGTRVHIHIPYPYFHHESTLD